MKQENRIHHDAPGDMVCKIITKMYSCGGKNAEWKFD